MLGRILGNLAALTACYEQASKEGCDVLAHTGDVVGPGPFPSDCVRFLRERNIPGVRGRREEALTGQSGRLHAADRLWLQNLPFELRLALGPREMAIFHAGPISLMDALDRAMPEEALTAAGKEAGAGIVVVASSQPWHRLAGGHHFVAAPAVDRPGTFQTGYAVIVSESTVQATFREVPMGQEPQRPAPDPQSAHRGAEIVPRS